MTNDQKPIPRRPARQGLERPITAQDAPAASDPLGFDTPGTAEVELPPITADDRAAARASGGDSPWTRGPARRPSPQVSDPLIQWSTGLPTREKTIYAGWLIEAGRSDALDAAMAEADFTQVTIRHGSGNLVTHWAIETANLFVICEGVQSIAEMKTAYTTERYGIAFGWRTLPDGRRQSQLRCRVLLRELLAVGYQEPLLVSVKSTLTGDMLTALTRQYEVLDAIEAFRKESGKPPLSPPFYACSVPLGPGQEVARGREQTKEIAPIVARIPSPITRGYILAHYIKREWATLIEGLLDQTVAWSVQASVQIAAGEEEGSNGDA